MYEQKVNNQTDESYNPIPDSIASKLIEKDNKQEDHGQIRIKPRDIEVKESNAKIQAFLQRKAQIEKAMADEENIHVLRQAGPIRAREDDSDELRLRKKYEFQIPQKLKKTCWCVSILLIIGLTLFTVGLIKAIVEDSFKAGVTYFILSFILIIPGGFYTYQFIKARCSKDIDKREEILSEIPQL